MLFPAEDAEAYLKMMSTIKCVQPPTNDSYASSQTYDTLILFADEDINIATEICNKLEQHGLKVYNIISNIEIRLLNALYCDTFI